MAEHENALESNPKSTPEKPAADGAGGMSSLFTDPARRRSDMRMIERAIRKGWEIPPALYAALPGELVRLLAPGSKASNRDKLRAVSLLMSMHRDNVTLAAAQLTQGGPQAGITPEAMVRAMMEVTAPPPPEGASDGDDNGDDNAPSPDAPGE